MNAWLAWSAEARLTCIGIAGVVLGAIVNWAVSSLAYEPRHFSPWSRKHPRDERSSLVDRLPIVGWLRLRRKTKLLGAGFWIRPLFIESALPTALIALYAWEIPSLGLLPRPLAPGVEASPIVFHFLHYEYFAHSLLLAFMIAASLVDADEKIIPDSITVPGTLAGLTLITLEPWALLPIDADPLRGVAFLRATFGLERAQGDVLNQAFPNVASLAIGAFCYLLWCGGLLYRPWRTSRGLGTAFQILFRGVRRDPHTPWIALLTVVGLCLIGIVWRYSALNWLGLASSLVGAAVGGSIVWIVRVVAGWALQRQAMGFGDVTLMTMIGAIVGWQAAVLIFFAAPIAALAVHGSQWLFNKLLGRKAFDDLPYGPYLCLSTAAIVVGWRWVWEVVEPRFAVPWLIPAVLVVGFVLLGLILGLLQALRSR